MLILGQDGCDYIWVMFWALEGLQPLIKPKRL